MSNSGYLSLFLLRVLFYVLFWGPRAFVWYLYYVSCSLLSRHVVDISQSCIKSWSFVLYDTLHVVLCHMSWTFIYIEFDLSIHASVVLDMYTMWISQLTHIHVCDFITCLSYAMFVFRLGILSQLVCAPYSFCLHRFHPFSFLFWGSWLYSIFC